MYTRELDDFKIIFLTLSFEVYEISRPVALYIVKPEIHQIKKESKEKWEKYLTHLAVHFLAISWFLLRMSSGLTFLSRQSLFSHNQLILEIFPLSFSCFLTCLTLSKNNSEILKWSMAWQTIAQKPNSVSLYLLFWGVQAKTEFCLFVVFFSF